jgi:hypothetical protein
MTEKPEETPKSKIYEQNQNKQVNFNGLEITGDLGAGVIIHSSQSDMTVINIAGGVISGDAYQIVSRGKNTRAEEIDQLIKEMDTDDETREHLGEAIKELRDQITSGDQADMAMVNYLLNWVGEISPELLDTLVRWILESPDAGEEAKTFAQESLRRQHRKRKE